MVDEEETNADVGRSIGIQTQNSAESEEVEVVDIMPREELGQQGKKGNGNVVDFGSFLKEAGMLDSRGCGGSEENVNSPSLGCMAAGIEPFRNLADEIHVHVPLSLKQQIWRGEFINLAILLKGSVELTNMCAPNVLRVMADVTLEARPRECKDIINSIEKWTDAFMIFMSIVIINKPDKAAEMLRYMSLIREVSQNGGYAWRTYDTQFRIRLAVYPAP